MDASLPSLVQQMLQPGFYPHPVTEPIKLLQTHISYVFLTGDYAYKVKKHIKFGFLDFSTLALRSHFCQEELRLNCRLAPDLYRAVLPITQSSPTDQFQLNASGPVVEYTVQMRQFQESGLELFHQGQLTPKIMQTLAQQVAQFHQTAATNAEICANGSVTAINEVDENNFQLSLPFVGWTQTEKQFEETYRYIKQFVHEHQDWYAQRQAEGKIRECHGDLHLNNLCLFQDQIQVFDCIEFNTEFRNIDTIYDVAFLVMDLQFHQRPDLAIAFLNTYLERTGDYWSVVMLPPYLAMRAYIRGNVSSLALKDAAISVEQKQVLQEQALAYYRLAWQYTQRPQGRLLLMSGLSGSGKSTVARQLATQIHAIHIRSDAVRKHLAGVPLEQKGTDELYTSEMTQQTYKRLLELGLLLAQQGWTVILDAKYDQPILRREAITTATEHNIPLHILHCTAPIEILKDRIRHRHGDITDATVDLLTQQQEQAAPFLEQEQQYLVKIDTSTNWATQLESWLSGN
ncbi:MAG: AAA family ATPase [Thermosynechococcaceae cyanobacterium]